MAKPVVRAAKSYQDGHIQVQVKAGASRIGQSVSSTVSVDLDLDAACALQCELNGAILKAQEKIRAKAASDARRKAWREREVAAGRLKIITFKWNP